MPYNFETPEYFFTKSDVESCNYSVSKEKSGSMFHSKFGVKCIFMNNILEMEKIFPKING